MMEFHFSLYQLPLIIAAISAGLVSAYVVIRHATRSVPALVGLGLALMIWSIGYTFEIGSVGLEAKVLWGKVEYIGIALTPLMWFIFAYNHASRDKIMSHRAMFLAAAIPVITIVLAFTTEQHGLLWKEVSLLTTPEYSVLQTTRGPWFTVHLIYSYALLLIGSYYIVQTVRHVWGPYRGQAVALLIAVTTPWIANVIYLTGLSPLRDLDPTPFAFTITLLAMVWGIFGFRLMDLSPVARDMVVQDMPDGMLVLDAQARIADMNPAAERLLGIGAAQTISRPIREVLSAWPQVLDRFSAVSEVVDEITVGTAEAQRWYEVRISPLKDRRQSVTGRVITIRNITERRRTEERLMEERNLLRTVIDNVPDQIFVRDLNNKFILSNLSDAQAMNVEDPETLVGKNDYDFYPPELAASFQADNLVVMQTGEPLISREERARDDADGQPRWVLTTKVPLRDRQGKIAGLVGIARDISKRKRAEQALELAHEQALAANRYKSELMAKVSHELRTPLGAILGYAELLHKEMFAPLTPQQKHFTQEILDSVIYLNGLVSDLLDEARLERGRIEIQLSPVDVRQMVDQLKVTMEPLAHAKGLNFCVQVSPELPAQLIGDQKRLRQILTNLINNAIKFTATGSVDVELQRPDLQHWSMEVRDTGPGMPPEVQSRIFEAFWQADGSATRQHEGYGLGLSIVKQLVDLMNGELSVQSEINRGSTFRVVLPLNEPVGS